MTRYCAFLAAINVGGNRLTMVDLRHAFEREDLENIETVIASGNLLFDYEDRPTQGLEDLFEHVMQERFDIRTFAAVRNKDEVRAAFEDNPFAGVPDDKFAHTVLLERQPTQEQFDAMMAAYEGRGNEKLALGERCLFVDYVDGVGNSKLTAGFIERRLGCRGTARNVRSLARIWAKM